MENQGMSLENYISSSRVATSITIQLVLKAAMELNVFNIIAQSGPGAQLSSEEIVSKIPTSNPNAVESLERILRFLSAHSLLSTSLRPCPNEETVQERIYGLTNDTLCLVPNEDGFSLSPMLMLGSGIEHVKSLHMLKYSVLEEGCVPFYKAHGGNLYEHMSKRPELGRLFYETMVISSILYFEKGVEVYKGFQEVKELMDVGGGTGSWLAKIVSIYPHIHGINFDLPNVVAHAPKHQGVKHVGGNMFESIPKAQSIMLKWVLHNWDDDQCKKLLRNCWEALPEIGKVIVVEFAIPEVWGNTAELSNIVTLDIYMMNYFGGKERTTTELDNLAKAVGFVETKIFPISHDCYFIEFLKNKLM